MACAAALDNALPNAIDITQQDFVVAGKITLSGNYVDHGDIMSLAGLCNSNSLPTRVDVYQEPTAGNAPIAFSFIYAKGTTIALGKLLVIDTTTGLPIAAGAYDAALTAATANIKFRAWLPMFV